ncbi:hypothetical protein [Yoonia sp.]|uniref:hypothetical protein n=1 Tax=Yoonia sp. TaxID=2212373 RepID=UPI00238C0E93|nr:hypothetical protein [Yoonia sp.]MDE0849707.1 hypothetical protein [Yoonia sp.]
MVNKQRIFRWIVFLLAAFYCLRTLFFSDFGNFGGPFRFLTIWALFFSFFAASRMMALEEGRSTRRWDGFVGMTAVINAMVVFLYWRLFFADPTSVTSDGELGQFYLEMYLHGLGPALQIIDAIFVHRSYRKLLPAMAWLFGVIAAYVAWAELVVGPMNASPIGTVTTGLPYPFLNNLEPSGRAVFYGSNFAIGLVLLLVFAGAAWLIRRTFPLQTVPLGQHGSQDKAAPRPTRP